MKKQSKRHLKLLPFLLAVTLTAAACLCMNACGKKEREGAGTDTALPKTVTVKVTDDTGKETVFTVTTKEATLGAALLQEGLIEGEEGPYGLYVKVVNGITADYDENGAYWSFTRNGTVLMTGVDATPIADGDVFGILYTK